MTLISKIPALAKGVITPRDALLEAPVCPHAHAWRLNRSRDRQGADKMTKTYCM
jgi:hypothetical protein